MTLNGIGTDVKNDNKALNVEIEYVGEELKFDLKDPNFQYFSRVFDAFKVFY